MLDNVQNFMGVLNKKLNGGRDGCCNNCGSSNVTLSLRHTNNTWLNCMYVTNESYGPYTPSIYLGG